MLSVEVDRPSASASHTEGLRPAGDSSEPARKQARIGASDALLIVATGILLVALAYTRSPGNSGFATALFWTGQILVFAVVVVRILNPATPAGEREFFVFLYAGAQSLLRWSYCPDMFRWYDELQHYRSLLNVLATHHLFHPNFSLPISPRYPGLENVTAELTQVSSLSPFLAGVLIAALSHILLAGSLLLLFREITQSSRVACIGVIIYLLSPQIHYFDTSFVYETMALPFLALSIYFSIRFATRGGQRYPSFAGLLSCVLLVVITHHLAALATVGMLAGIALATWLFRGTRDLAFPLAICAVSATVIVGSWMLFFATDTGEYLSGAVQNIVSGLKELGHVEGKAALPTGLAVPLFDRICNPGGVALMLVLLAVGMRLARSRPPLERAVILIAPGSYALMISIRLFVGSPPTGGKPDGAELAIRMLTYVSFFTAIAVAVVLNRIVSTADGDRRSALMPSGLVTATAVAIALLLHSITTGLPQWWQRLPGVFRIDGYASGIDTVGLSRAEWAAANLQPGSRYFGDVTSVYLLAPLAQLDPVNDPGSLYDTDRLIPEDSALIDGLLGIYLDVDLRMAHEAPIIRSFFISDVMAGRREVPIYESGLTKFDHFPGIARIYDSGYDHFYDLRGVKGIYGN